MVSKLALKKDVSHVERDLFLDNKNVSLEEIERLLGHTEDDIAMYEHMVRQIRTVEKDQALKEAVKIELVGKVAHLQ